MCLFDLERYRATHSFVTYQFYHLSPEYELHGLPSLVKEAERRFGPQEDYGKMTVAEQVQRELGMIALFKE